MLPSRNRAVASLLRGCRKYHSQAAATVPTDPSRNMNGKAVRVVPLSGKASRSTRLPVGEFRPAGAGLGEVGPRDVRNREPVVFRPSAPKRGRGGKAGGVGLY